MPASPAPPRRFALGDLPLAAGGTLASAWLDYRVYGTLASDRSNLVLYPSSYGAWPEDIDWVVGPILDPQRWCVVLVSQFGNGRSTSPSNAGPGLVAGRWPVDHRDNVAAQRRLLEEVFRVASPALIYGWSMGAQQAYHWAVLEPERTQRICCVCGTARTTAHNRVFLLSLRQALTADPHWDGLRFQGVPEQGLRTFALIYASWAASQPFYRRGAHRQLGYASVEAYVEQAWLPAYRRHDPHDLLAMLDVWLANDVAAAAGISAAGGDGSGGGGGGGGGSGGGGGDPDADLAAALGRVRARTAVIAGRHDLYFTPDDCQAEAALIRDAHFEVLESDLGHRAGNPRDSPAEQGQLRAAVNRLCAD
ncbi:alpha/beta fold hydrolase [Aphanothece minutissima]|uniref:Homoserine acetyltransferase n=1 Tax=Aphanothece cf. minutissima CCALA 015 TaxID=2107695 RepID=A0ABX5F6S4_9CHRO|nr:alpha/beta fold hydrolase [Aphanothece minutissima]PSB36084.1 homoserine acetyltransferase [Aphanothece cf. minutissima CCALA 015]